MRKILIFVGTILCVASMLAQQSYIPGKLTVILKDQALQRMIRHSNGTATLPNAASLNALNNLRGLVAMRPLSKKAGSEFRGYFEFQFPTTANLQAVENGIRIESACARCRSDPDERNAVMRTILSQRSKILQPLAPECFK